MRVAALLALGVLAPRSVQLGCTTRTPAPTPTRARASARASASASASTPLVPLRYTGGLLGVRADVTLLGERAHVRLRGVPLGGVVEGDAWFARDGGAGVVLDAALERALRRRCVRIDAIGVADDANLANVANLADVADVWVAVRLPLVGRRTVRLRRVDSEQ